MENFKFESEVLQRLKAIETKIDDYKDITKVAYEANNRSKENTKDITEMKDSIEKGFSKIEEDNKNTRRTAIGAIISVGITILGGIIAIISGWFHKGGTP